MDFAEQIRQEAERIKKKIADRASGGGGGNQESDFRFFSVGNNFTRIVPPKPGSRSWARAVYTHYDLPAGIGTQRCLSSLMFPDLGIECPYCRVGTVLADYTQDISGEPGVHYYPNMVHYTQEGSKFVPVRLKPFLTKCSPTIYDAIVLHMADAMVGIDKIMSTGDGFPLNIIRPADFEGKNQYQVQIVPFLGPLAGTPDDVQKIISGVIDFERIWKKPSADDVNKAIANAQTILNSYRNLIGNLNVVFAGAVPPASGSTPAAPSAASTPSAPVAADNRKFWVACNGASSLHTVPEILQLMSAGKVQLLMNEDQSGGWKDPKELL